MSKQQEASQLGTDREIVLSFRLGDVDPLAFQPKHVDVHLTASQRRALKRLTNAWQGVPLNNGRLVQGGPDVIRRLLELIEDQAGRAVDVAVPEGSTCR